LRQFSLKLNSPLKIIFLDFTILSLRFIPIKSLHSCRDGGHLVLEQEVAQSQIVVVQVFVPVQVSDVESERCAVCFGHLGDRVLDVFVLEVPLAQAKVRGSRCLFVNPLVQFIKPGKMEKLVQKFFSFYFPMAVDLTSLLFWCKSFKINLLIRFFKQLISTVMTIGSSPFLIHAQKCIRN